MSDVVDTLLRARTDGLRADALHPEAEFALPDKMATEGSARLTARGRKDVLALVASLADRSTPRRTVLDCELGSMSVAEFEEVDEDGSVESSVFAIQLDGGLIRRVLGFRHPPVPPATTRVNTPIHPDLARSTVLRYLDALEAGRIAETLKCFTDDAIYSFGPRLATGAREIAQGHSRLERVFQDRGVNSARHRVEFALPSRSGADLGVVGRVESLPGGGSAAFVSCVSFGPDGRIARYVAQSCVPEPFPWARS